MTHEKLSVDDGKVFMEEVRYNLHQIQLRYGTVTEKAESRLDRAKYAANQVEDGDEESRQLSALTTVNQAVPSGDDKHHAGEIVVTSFSPQNKSESQLVSSKPVISRSEPNYTVLRWCVTYFRLPIELVI